MEKGMESYKPPTSYRTQFQAVSIDWYTKWNHFRILYQPSCRPKAIIYYEVLKKVCFVGLFCLIIFNLISSFVNSLPSFLFRCQNNIFMRKKLSKSLSTDWDMPQQNLCNALLDVCYSFKYVYAKWNIKKLKKLVTR